MSLLESALKLASKHFYVFPLAPNTKDQPLFKGWQELATHDENQIREWWTKWPNANIGIYTGKFNGGHEALLVIDVDNKGDKKGDETLLKLELEGFEFPTTAMQITPTGGKHLIYRVKEAVKQGVNVLGPGLDIRSKGGYIVGAGSFINGVPYKLIESEMPEATERVVRVCGKARERVTTQVKSLVDQNRAHSRGIYYLENEAPKAVEGAGGDHTTFVVACMLKDFGVELNDAFNLMLNHWNQKCSPPWMPSDLRGKVENAYRYGMEAVGARSPDVAFDAVKVDSKKLSPIKELNKQFAFIILGGGGYVLKETKASDGANKVDYLTVPAFNQLMAPHKMTNGSGKSVPLADAWMKSPDRRTYEGLCFIPGKEAPPSYYNLWKDFSVPKQIAVSQEAQNAFNLFISHVKENICSDDPLLFDWVVSFMAHLVQKPWEKPLVSLVLRGKKGVGKNAFVERIGELISEHFLVVANHRYLTSNFNAHMEKLLMIVFDEAFWSGDKAAEGILKGLITGGFHTIERKGKESYQTPNYTRIVILGNEDWVVPASEDERRFCVLDVGEKRRKDTLFFRTMTQGMKNGGNTLLLNYLLNYKGSADIDVAPQTAALTKQKLSSLSIFHQFWFESLKEGKIPGYNSESKWVEEIDKSSFRSAFKHYIKDRNSAAWVPHDDQLTRLLKSCVPKLEMKRKTIEEVRMRCYVVGTLESCRANFEKFIGDRINWDE